MKTTLSQKQSPGDILDAALHAWNITKTSIAEALGASYPTMLKLTRDPELMDGKNRQALAEKLNLPIDIIDDLINGKFSTADEFIQLVSVPPIVQK